MEDQWEKLSHSIQKYYEEKAEYLIERGYVSGKNKNELAKQIYANNVRNNIKE